MKDLRILIIGAGGVASYLCPVLSRFQVANVHISIMDGDRLEKRNLDRQLFTDKFIGKNKATSLMQIADLDVAIPSFLTANTVNEVKAAAPDAMFCLVDNDQARKLAYEVAMQEKIHFFTAANEMFDASARYINPKWYRTEKCLFKVNPDLIAPSPSEGINCTGRMTEQFPQLAMANSMAAQMALHLFYIHCIEDFSDDVKEILPSYISRNLTSYECN